MKTAQLQQLIQAMTKRGLTLDCADEIPLESTVGVYRVGRPKSDGNWPWFTWKTPKDEDNLIRSFITAFCSKYREPDPATYLDYSGKPRFCEYAAKWNDPATRPDSPCWNHHASMPQPLSST